MLKQIEHSLSELLASGKGIYGCSLYDFKTNESFAYKENESFYAASIIKVPIMAAVFAHAYEGECRLTDKIQIHEEDFVPGDGILKHLSAGMEWSIYDLLVLMIIESDNTATNVLIDLVGVENIAAHMTRWGFKKSQLNHKLQISPDRKPGELNVIIPNEINQFLIHLASGRVVSIKACEMMINILKQQKMNGLLPRLLPDAEGAIGMIPNWEAAHKTGYVSGVEHNVGLFYFPGHTYAISIMSKNIVNRNEPRRIMGEIGQLIFNVSR
ncbi:class A beta-lactamase-related serine hydrolase [Fictibacillus nanhaiensis]|uniref:serine hydrolase n=1 Tax=Fictibacillus nanhaiensis TaxID=742169 RepID=UPI002E1F54AD|nr:class A beta-lactamase-related serine hydrolase [Fictibacillus nanhaiensis]